MDNEQVVNEEPKVLNTDTNNKEQTRHLVPSDKNLIDSLSMEDLDAYMTVLSEFPED